MTDITEHLTTLRARVQAATRAAGRGASCVTIVAVSKQQAAAAVEAAYRAGQRDFGENYLQEAEAKIAAVRHDDIRWHFIGRVQANKTRAVAQSFDWVHTVDRERIARRLAEQRPAHAPPLNVLIQVNLRGEAQKGGVAPEALEALAAAIRPLDRLALRGLMTIPPADAGADATRADFERLRALRDELNRAGHTLDTLSMGMSADFELAIAAGSTCVRIGTAIFGTRPAARPQR